MSEQGRIWVNEEYSKPENLDLDRVLEWIGFDAESLGTLVTKGMIYRIMCPKTSKTYRYPRWQFEVDTVRMAKVIRAYGKIITGWRFHYLMIKHNDELGLSPAVLVMDPTLPLDPVLTLIKDSVKEA